MKKPMHAVAALALMTGSSFAQSAPEHFRHAGCDPEGLKPVMSKEDPTVVLYWVNIEGWSGCEADTGGPTVVGVTPGVPNTPTKPTDNPPVDNPPTDNPPTDNPPTDNPDDDTNGDTSSGGGNDDDSNGDNSDEKPKKDKKPKKKRGAD